MMVIGISGRLMARELTLTQMGTGIRAISVTTSSMGGESNISRMVTSIMGSTSTVGQKARECTFGLMATSFEASSRVGTVMEKGSGLNGYPMMPRKRGKAILMRATMRMIRNTGRVCLIGLQGTITKVPSSTTSDMATVRCIGSTVATTRAIGRRDANTEKESCTNEPKHSNEVISRITYLCSRSDQNLVPSRQQSWSGRRTRMNA
jgi:hypothetical protein